MKKQNKFKIGIRVKVALFICLTTLIVMVVGVSLGYLSGGNLLRDTVGKEHSKIANMLAVSVSRIVEERIKDIEEFSNSPFWKEAIRECNLKYEAMGEEAIQHYLLDMDKRWIEAPDADPLIREYLESRVSTRLRVLAEDRVDMAEIFLTDKVGALVASSGKTSDFYQADEEWWKKSFANGEGKAFIGDIVFDESVNTLSLSFAVPVRDESDKVIGICKAVMDVKRFFGYLCDFRIGKTGHAVLVDKEGYIIYHYGIEPLTTKFLSYKDSEKLAKSKRAWVVVDSPHIHDGKVFLACADIKQPFLLEQGAKWIVCIDQEAKEVFAPLNTLLHQGVMLSIVLIVLLMPLAFAFGGVFAKPIRQLHEATERIAEGYLNRKVGTDAKDEIGQLSRAFDKMTEKLKMTMVSRRKLIKEVSKRKRLEEELRSLSLHDELTGLYNRRGFMTLGEQQLKLAQRIKSTVFLLYGDIDRMKWINDTLGHQEGDKTLRETADMLKGAFRESDIIARIGGDEFVVLTIGTSKAGVKVLTARLQESLDARNAKGTHRYNLSLSIGITHYDPKHPCSLDELVAQADKLMYEHKRSKQKK